MRFGAVKLLFLFENFSDRNFAAVKTTNLKNMKRYLLLIGVAIAIAVQGFAEKSGICMDIAKRGHNSKTTTVRRSPMRIPIYVFYDNDTHQIEVVGDDELAAQVFLSDENGNTLDYSPCINAMLDVPCNYNGILLIRIESEDWIATGNIAI